MRYLQKAEPGETVGKKGFETRMEDLVIAHTQNGLVTGLFEAQKLIEVFSVGEGEDGCLGNIYNAKIQNIVKNIEAVFVEYEKGKVAYLSMKDCQEALVRPLLTREKEGKKWKLCIGDELLIQIEKEGIKTKSPAATCRLNFPGRFVVLVHGTGTTGVSSKIHSKKRKEELRGLAREFMEEMGEGFHLVFRTNAEETPDDLLREELGVLFARYQKVLKEGRHRTVFSVVEKAPSMQVRAVKDQRAGSLHRILTDDRGVYEEIQAYLKDYQKEDLGRLKFYEEEGVGLDALYGISSQLTRALQPRVWLKSGAYLVIEPTEALTVIDVNTGKAIAGKREKEETLWKVNREAAVEVARQLRLRNLTGMILVDFIDMEKPENQKLLIATLREAIAKDPVKTSYIDLTKLYLVELTRKRTRRPLHEMMAHYRRGES